MGSLILCHKKHARQPFEITRIHRRIYTIEELCYYLCNNLYLIDYTIVNLQLCDWLEDELELKELADKLRKSIQNHGSIEKFVVSILSASAIYTSAELNHIQNVLEHLKNQKDIERRKYKADNLLESGEVEAAVLIYQSIIHGERDETVDGKFYGRVYQCLGAAFGRLFLYEEAAAMYEAAFQICEEEELLMAYLYCCMRYLPQTKYKALLEKSEIYANLDVLLHEEIAEFEEEEEMPEIHDAALMLEQWKQQYRRCYT